MVFTMYLQAHLEIVNILPTAAILSHAGVLVLLVIVNQMKTCFINLHYKESLPAKKCVLIVVY